MGNAPIFICKNMCYQIMSMNHLSGEAMILIYSKWLCPLKLYNLLRTTKCHHSAETSWCHYNQDTVIEL